MANAIFEACKGLDQELVIMTLTALKGYSDDYQKNTVKKVKEGQDFNLHVPLSKYLTAVSRTRVVDYDGSILGLSQEAGSSGIQLQAENSSSVEEYKDNEAAVMGARRASLPTKKASGREYKDTNMGAGSGKQLQTESSFSVEEYKDNQAVKTDARRASLPTKNISCGEYKDSKMGTGEVQLLGDKGQSVKEYKDSKSKPKSSKGLVKGQVGGTKKLQSGASNPPKEYKDKAATTKASGPAHDPKYRLSREGVAKGPLTKSGNGTNSSVRKSYSETLKKANGIKQGLKITAVKPSLTILKKKVQANVNASSQAITSRTPSKRKLSIGSPEPIREDKDNEGLPLAKKRKETEKNSSEKPSVTVTFKSKLPSLGDGTKASNSGSDETGDFTTVNSKKQRVKPLIVEGIDKKIQNNKSAIEMVIGHKELYQLRITNQGNILLNAKTTDDREKLLALKVNGLTIRPTVATKATSASVDLSALVQGVPLDLTDQVLSDSTDRKCKRIISGKSGNPTKLVRVYAKNQDDQEMLLKNGLVINGISSKCIAYVPKTKPVQCYKCQAYGHTSVTCKRAEKCRRCSGAHRYSNCTETLNKCANCSGNHPSNYPGCQALKQASEARATNLLSYAQTTKKVSSEDAFRLSLTLTRVMTECFKLLDNKVDKAKIAGCVTSAVNHIHKTTLDSGTILKLSTKVE